ncbi:MAG: terminase family protein [Thermodesulfovibrionales bacterium]|jgi:hypothetical protein
MRSRAPRILVNCSRQSGKSTTTAALALHESLYRKPSVGLAVAPALRQSKELMEKFDEFRSAVELSSDYMDEDTKLSIRFNNGNRFMALPGSEKTIRGISAVTLLLEDEAARVEDALKHSVSPMLAVSGGRYIEMSTPWGKRGHFFEAWTNGKGWEKYEVTADQCPRITPEFLQSELDNGMPKSFWLQEYYCQFLDMEDQLFTYDLVNAAFDGSVEALEF